MRDEIKTEQLTLRRPALSDASNLAQWINNYDVAKQTATVCYPYSYLHAEYWALICPALWRQGLAYNYVIVVKHKTIGSIGLFRQDIAADFEIGYMLSQNYWGQGLMTEAVEALLHEGAQQLGLKTCHAGIFSDNPGSARLLSKFGFIKTTQDAIFSMARGRIASGSRYVCDLTALQ